MILHFMSWYAGYRSKEVEKKLKEAEKQAKDNAAKAYINPVIYRRNLSSWRKFSLSHSTCEQEIAAQEKERGNSLVKEAKYVEVKKQYTVLVILSLNLLLLFDPRFFFAQAKAAYDEAIRRNPADHTLYRLLFIRMAFFFELIYGVVLCDSVRSNRALCYMKLMEWPSAKVCVLFFGFVLASFWPRIPIQKGDASVRLRRLIVTKLWT
jgi:tetratricopeptide (TPR) repeat protein